MGEAANTATSGYKQQRLYKDGNDEAREATISSNKQQHEQAVQHDNM